MPKVSANAFTQMRKSAHVALLAGEQPQPLEHREVAAEPDGKRRKDDVEGDGEGELDAREQDGIEAFDHLRPAPPA